MAGGTEARKHRLLLELGRGGMGTVYLAATQGPMGFEKLKVVKRLRSGMVDDAQFLQMFLEEARLSARLNHPNIVQTNEVGFDGQDYFIEMEYLDGQPLDAIRRRAAKSEGMPTALWMWILGEVLAGLGYAHELKDHAGRPLAIVHRDVSPHNVFVTYDGVVKLLDFGIAKAVDSSSETRTGVVKGKVTYMSPEQATRKRVDGRADVFAVGVMMWETLTKKRMWEGLHEGEILHRLVAGDVPRARDVEAGIDERLDAICARALAVDPEERFTAAQMAAEIEDWLQTSGAKSGQRVMAKWMVEQFTDRRAATQAEIHEQLTKTDQREVDVPTLGGSPAFQATISGHTTKGLRVESTAAEAPQSLRDVPVSAGPEDRTGAVTRSDTGESRQRQVLARTVGPSAGSWRRRSVALIALGSTVAVALAAWWLAPVRPKSAPPAGSVAAAVAAAGCTTSGECIRQHNGAPFICRATDHVCAPLESQDCRVDASPQEIESDETLWLGVMFPFRDMNYPNGSTLPLWEVHAVQLAQSDFAKTTGGIPRPDNPRGPRPFATIICDDQASPTRAAKHLAEEVGVPAVIGFGSGAEAMDLLTHVFLPSRTLVVDSRTVSPLLSSLPMPGDAPRLLWRTDPSESVFGDAARALVEQTVGPALVKRSPGETAPQDLRLAIIKDDSADASAVVDRIVDRLSVDGGDFAKLRDNVRPFLLRGTSGPPTAEDRTQAASVAVDIARFKPQVVLVQDLRAAVWTSLLPALESSAPAVRPTYVVVGGLWSPALNDFVQKDPERRARVFGIDFEYKTPQNARFLQHYAEAYPEALTPSNAPTTSYDAAYLVAMAAAAVGDQPVTGVGLAGAIKRLQPPGAAVSVGPSSILDAIKALRAGGNVDLVGASGGLDFDMDTGDAHVDLIVDCLKTGGGTDSGARYDARSGRIIGRIDCR